MAIVSRGFKGRPRRDDSKLPPGQYLTDGFPVLSTGPTPRITHEQWEFVVSTETGTRHRWSWAELLALPAESPLHCVTKWSKFDTRWQGVSLGRRAPTCSRLLASTAASPPARSWVRSLR
jgi:DMSO/TMAO reductase YedYZ molybdopterin-dependent catalytic subunit